MDRRCGGAPAAIYERIHRDSELYAQRVVDRLIWRSEQLSDFPLSGRLVPEYYSEEIREMIEGPYRIIYRVMSDQIDILALVHGSQLLPPDLTENI